MPDPYQEGLRPYAQCFAKKCSGPQDMWQCAVDKCGKHIVKMKSAQIQMLKNMKRMTESEQEKKELDKLIKQFESLHDKGVTKESLMRQEKLASQLVSKLLKL